ncbi:MAG: hypothetical protein ABSB63_07005 [Spirochaetia bacterium]|jgi:hypothetical protein
MKNSMFPAILFVVLSGIVALPEAESMPMFGGWFDSGERSPAVAALLSLTPMPIAFGQFYAGDWATGLLFSFVETAEAATTIGVVVYEGTTMMHAGVPIRDWDSTGQVVFFSALGSFVITKFVDALTAGLAADAYNKKQSAGKVSLVVRDREVGLSFGYRY